MRKKIPYIGRKAYLRRIAYLELKAYLKGKVYPYRRVYTIKKRGIQGEEVHYFYWLGKVRIFLGVRVEIWVDYPLMYGQKTKVNKWFLSVKRANRFIFLILNKREEFLKRLSPKHSRDVLSMNLRLDISKRWAGFLYRLYRKDREVVWNKIPPQKK